MANFTDASLKGVLIAHASFQRDGHYTARTTWFRGQFRALAAVNQHSRPALKKLQQKFFLSRTIYEFADVLGDRALTVHVSFKSLVACGNTSSV